MKPKFVTTLHGINWLYFKVYQDNFPCVNVDDVIKFFQLLAGKTT